MTKKPKRRRIPFADEEIDEDEVFTPEDYELYGDVGASLQNEDEEEDLDPETGEYDDLEDMATFEETPQNFTLNEEHTEENERELNDDDIYENLTNVAKIEDNDLDVEKHQQLLDTILTPKKRSRKMFKLYKCHRKKGNIGWILWGGN